MAVTLIALILLEVILQLAWNPLYFNFGISVFNERIPAAAEIRSRLKLNSLERDVATDTGFQLVFHTLPDGSVAFRESYLLSSGSHYYPVMRGRVIVDAKQRIVRVVGLCNWNVLCISLSLLPMIALLPKATPMLLILPLFFYSYWVQRRKFLSVAEAIRQQLEDDRSVESLLAKHAAAKRQY